MLDDLPQSFSAFSPFFSDTFTPPTYYQDIRGPLAPEPTAPEPTMAAESETTTFAGAAAQDLVLGQNYGTVGPRCAEEEADVFMAFWEGVVTAFFSKSIL